MQTITPAMVPRRPQWRDDVVRQHGDRRKASDKQADLLRQIREDSETDDDDTATKR